MPDPNPDRNREPNVTSTSDDPGVGTDRAVPQSVPAPDTDTIQPGLDQNPDRAQSSVPTAPEIPVHVGGDG